jgi:hypothetical protein
MYISQCYALLDQKHGGRIVHVLLAVIALGCIGGQAALGSSDPRLSAHAAARPAATRHRCPCGVDCGDSCCCSRRSRGAAGESQLARTVVTAGPARLRESTQSRPRAPSAPEAPGNPTAGRLGPCIGPFPCGQGAIPPSVPRDSRLLDSALVADMSDAAADRAESLSSLSPAVLPGQNAPDPLDKPPRLRGLV